MLNERFNAQTNEMSQLHKLIINFFLCNKAPLSQIPRIKVYLELIRLFPFNHSPVMCLNICKKFKKPVVFKKISSREEFLANIYINIFVHNFFIFFKYHLGREILGNYTSSMSSRIGECFICFLWNLKLHK